MKVRKAGPTTMVSRAKELYKEDAKDGDAEERGAERVRMELGETCHNGWMNVLLFFCSDLFFSFRFFFSDGMICFFFFIFCFLIVNLCFVFPFFFSDPFFLQAYLEIAT